MDEEEPSDIEMIQILCEQIEFLINNVSQVTMGKEEYAENATKILSEMME